MLYFYSYMNPTLKSQKWLFTAYGNERNKSVLAHKILGWATYFSPLWLLPKHNREAGEPPQQLLPVLGTRCVYERDRHVHFSSKHRAVPVLGNRQCCVIDEHRTSAHWHANDNSRHSAVFKESHDWFDHKQIIKVEQGDFVRYEKHCPILVSGTFRAIYISTNNQQ